MKLNSSALVAVLLLVAAASSETKAQTPQLFFQPDTSLETANMAELRRGHQIQKLAQCALPVIAVHGDWITSRGPDDYFWITLPPDWKREKYDRFPLPGAAFGAANGDGISVTRLAFAAAGMPSLRNEMGVVKPDRQCEVSNDKSGSILSFYSGQGRVLGEAVTPEGKHYGIAVTSTSPANLDTLVALVTRAVLTSRQH